MIVLVVLLLIFKNRETGDFNFLFFDLTAPKWLWLLGVFLAGFVAGLLFARNRARSKAKH